MIAPAKQIDKIQSFTLLRSRDCDTTSEVEVEYVKTKQIWSRTVFVMNYEQCWTNFQYLKKVGVVQLDEPNFVNKIQPYF